jgi:hypothetical protein
MCCTPAKDLYVGMDTPPLANDGCAMFVPPFIGGFVRFVAIACEFFRDRACKVTRRGRRLREQGLIAPEGLIRYIRAS